MIGEQVRISKVTDLYVDLSGTESFPIKIISDYRENGGSGVIDLGVFSADEMEKYTREGIEFYNSALDFWKNSVQRTDAPKEPSACSSCIKELDDGTIIMGRNMDVPSTFYPAYIFRGRGNGRDTYDTVSIGYCTPGPITFDQIAETSSIPEQLVGTYVANAFDVLNSEGLYLEANGRLPRGDAETSSTNPGAEVRIETLLLTRLIGDHCATIEEAIEYVKTLDIYTGETAFAVAMMDKTGRYGVLETAYNKTIWNEGRPGYACGQTNFYWDEYTRQHSNWSVGMGRWQEIVEHYNYINSKDDMEKLMEHIWYEDLITNGTMAKAWKCEFLTDYVEEGDAPIMNKWLDAIYAWRDEYGIEVDEKALARVEAIAERQIKENIVWDDKYVTSPTGRYEVVTLNDLYCGCFAQLPTEVQKFSGMMEITSIGYVCDNRNLEYKLRFFEMNDIYHITVDETRIDRIPCDKVLGRKK